MFLRCVSMPLSAAWSGEQMRLELLSTTQVVKDQLALSLEWCPVAGADPRLAVSDQDGNVSVWRLGDEAQMEQEAMWPAHTFPAWITCFDAWSPTTLYSGGDDCVFQGWDTRMPGHPTFRNRRHSMGVCSMQGNRNREHVLVTGWWVLPRLHFALPSTGACFFGLAPL